MTDDQISPRSRLVALLLCLLVGWVGAHRFYVGKIGTGVLMILTVGGCFGVWVLIDFVLIACGVFRDAHGRRVYRWHEPPPAERP